MPNTPILVGEGACGYCLGTQATHAHRALVHELLASSGVAVEVSEEVMDAVIGVSGSGPAYMFQARISLHWDRGEDAQGFYHILTYYILALLSHKWFTVVVQVCTRLQ
jgi:hypothetical protein